MALIELSEVHKRYALGENIVHALRGVTLSIQRGEFTALLGPSGSGKSTLMNTLGCLDRPTSGRYQLDGVDVLPLSRDERAGLRNQKIGFVFQNFHLLSRTSALENVELPMMYAAKLSALQRRRRAEELLERVGLGKRMDHHPAQLSGGQQQRVAIARALANQAPILLADEPTGNLDSHTSREILALFQQLNREENITVLIVTHDLGVARHARRSIVLHDGSLAVDTADHDEAEQFLRRFSI